LIGDITGGGTFEELQESAELVEIEGFQCRLVSLPMLIALKRAAGRGKDREALAELEALLEERDRRSHGE
jgi:predicted nucleotidyltransferase